MKFSIMFADRPQILLEDVPVEVTVKDVKLEVHLKKKERKKKEKKTWMELKTTASSPSAEIGEILKENNLMSMG